MYLIVGLGNPGKEYEKSRHNMGFQVIDKLALKWKVDISKEDFHGCYVKTKYDDKDVILLKPMTYMNLSGQSVMELAYFYKIDISNILVIFDDMDTIPGKIRLREKGSSGGQKGMKSIIDMLHTEDIKRIKIGIGRPTTPVIDYVLGRPSKEDEENIQKAHEVALKAIEAFLDKGFQYAVSRY